MKVVAPIRKALGTRTIFNLIGPLANPAPLTFQLVGVSESRLMRPMAEALVQLGIRHGMVVHGDDGLDEVTTTTTTSVLEVCEVAVTADRLDPTALDLQRARLDALRGGDAARNAAIARAILSDAPSAMHDIIVLNAGCALYVADRATTIREGIEQASESVASGRARQLLDRVKELSHAG